MEHWYALHTKPNSEYQVAATLHDRGITTYLPEIEAPKVRQKRKSKPFFPCYLFIQADLESIGLSQWQWTPGLRTIVTFGERPAPVSVEIIDLIQRKLGEIEAKGEHPIHPFRLGDPVRITDGPFQDMLAIFEGPATPAERVQVLLNILGQVSRVHIDVTDLEEASGTVGASTIKRPRRTRGRGRPIKGHHLI